jgi:hypothetical protein
MSLETLRGAPPTSPTAATLDMMKERAKLHSAAIDRVSTFIVQIGAVTPLVNGFVLNGVKLPQLPDWLPWYALAFAMVLHYIAYRQLKRWMPK